ncbi:Interferon alpha-inducible protein 27, mitochondrial [Plecturocebus cupreus]
MMNRKLPSPYCQSRQSPETVKEFLRGGFPSPEPTSAPSPPSFSLPTALAVGAVPVVLSAMGFTGAGIATSSIAAKMMSAAAIANGGGISAGSLVATLQSVGKCPGQTTRAGKIQPELSPREAFSSPCTSVTLSFLDLQSFPHCPLFWLLLSEVWGGSGGVMGCWVGRGGREPRPKVMPGPFHLGDLGKVPCPLWASVASCVKGSWTLHIIQRPPGLCWVSDGGLLGEKQTPQLNPSLKEMRQEKMYPKVNLQNPHSSQRNMRNKGHVQMHLTVFASCSSGVLRASQPALSWRGRRRA